MKTLIPLITGEYIKLKKEEERLQDLRREIDKIENKEIRYDLISGYYSLMLKEYENNPNKKDSEKYEKINDILELTIYKFKNQEEYLRKKEEFEKKELTLVKKIENFKNKARRKLKTIPAYLNTFMMYLP